MPSSEEKAVVGEVAGHLAAVSDHHQAQALAGDELGEAVRLIVGQRLAGPSILPVLDRLFAALRAAGLSARGSMVAYGLLWQYTAGELLHSRPEVDDDFAAGLTRRADPQRHPALAEAVAAFDADPPGDMFPENLQRLLDGLLAPAARRARG